MFSAAVATLGVAIVEESVGSPFRTETLAGGYEKYILMGAVLGFLFGFAVYWKWRYQSAFWVAAVGLCTFFWRMALGTPHADSPNEVMYTTTLAFISVRCLMYSLGAACCWLWFGFVAKSAEQTIEK